MATRARLALILLAGLAAVVLFLVLRPGDTADDASEAAGAGTTTTADGGAGTTADAAGETEATGTTEGTTTTGAATTAPTPTATTPRPRPSAPVIRVRGGERVSGPARITVRRGAGVAFDVVVDRPDELHIHGYERTVPLRANVPARIRFPATLEGIFEMELHGAGTDLATLVVRPS